MENLSHKEKTFVQGIVEGKNGTQAALIAYDTESYSTAGVIAHDNLKKPKIINAIHEALPDDLLAKKHLELLNSSKLDHMVFATGPKNKTDAEKWEQIRELKAISEGKEYEPTEYLTDDDIKELLGSVNCKVRRIVHRETARDVYFWSADNKARKDALDMAYEIKGTYAPKKSVTLNVDATASPAVRALTEKLNELHRGSNSGGDGVVARIVGDEVRNEERSGDVDRLHEAEVSVGHLQRPLSTPSTPEAAADRSNGDEHVQEPVGSQEATPPDHLHTTDAG